VRAEEGIASPARGKAMKPSEPLWKAGLQTALA
jgi:hypothetical protein